MTQEELKEFNKELHWIFEGGNEIYGELTDKEIESNIKDVIDFINSLLTKRQEKMIDWLDKQDENSPEYKTIFKTSEEDYCTCDFQNGDIIITDKENKHTKCGKRFLLNKPIQTSFSKLKEKIISLIKA